MDVWFAIPSANPDNCRKVLPIWKKMGYKTAVLQNFRRGEIPADISVWYDYYPGWPESVNILCREIVPKDAQIVVSGGDDMLPDPKLTAQELGKQFLERFPDTFGVMQPHGDEFLAAKRYCGSPFLGRKFFSTMYGGRGPMYGGYHHNWADNELYWLSKGMGVLWERPDVAHFHDHFTRDGRKEPDYWSSVRQKDVHDAFLLYARVHEGFPGHAPLGGGPEYKKPAKDNEMLLLATQRLASFAHDNTFVRRVAKALQGCAEAGQDRVAIYGSGYHTQQAGAALCEPPVEIDCIIDDNPGRVGKRLWNIPIVSLAEALKRPVKAVVLSGNSVEDRLWNNAEPFRARGIPVHRLYGTPEAEATSEGKPMLVGQAA